jgi:UDP:flavonoid glycosyltransferase YjiC (YdhE family)
MSKFLIPTIGTRGDVQPYIALALGLNQAGHETSIASHPCMRSLVESYGIRFAPMGPDIDIAHETALIRGHSPNWMLGFLRVMKFSFNMLEQSHPDLLSLCRQADWLIVSHTAAGSIEADQLGMPTISVTLSPQAIPAPDPNDSLLKRGVMRIAGAGMGLMMTRPLNQIRKRAGIPPMGPTGITSPRLNLIPISPEIYSPNPHWETRHKMTGYWFAPSPQKWTPSVELQDFLDAGEPPVIISLGAMSISGEDAQEAAEITLNAVQDAGVRAIIQGWDEPLGKIPLPANIFHGGSIPHEWLLPRSAGLMHHGGFGTTAAGFRAGIPQIVIPHIIDQFIWGQKVSELGVGPQPISRAKLKREILTEAIRQVSNDEAMRMKANSLGQRIRSERGVERAIELITETIAKG